MFNLASLWQTTNRALRRPVLSWFQKTRAIQPKAAKFYCRQQLIIVQRRNFYTTNVNPLYVKVAILLIRPVAKLFAMVFGRSLRGWWRSVPFQERLRRMRAWLYLHRISVSLSTGVVASPCIFFYVTHLEEVPIVRRRRFVPLTAQQFQAVSKAEEDIIVSSMKDQLVSFSSSEEVKWLYGAVTSVVKRVLRANAHLIPNMSDRNWTVFLVDNPQSNAFVVPSGSIFVFTGLFNVVSNEHELAMVMAHELSHVVLQHGLDNFIRGSILDAFLTIILAALWCVMPDDTSATVASWLSNKFAILLFKLPFSRNLEREADNVGLDLLSRACFDPRQAAVVWRKMDMLHEILNEYEFTPGKATKSETGSLAISQFLSSVASAVKLSDVDGAAIEQKRKELMDISKKEIYNPPTEVDFFSTHPSSAERYQNMREIIESGGTLAASKEGRCDHAELSKPLPSDYDSPVKLKEDMIRVMAQHLIKRPLPGVTAEPSSGK